MIFNDHGSVAVFGAELVGNPQSSIGLLYFDVSYFYVADVLSGSYPAVGEQDRRNLMGVGGLSGGIRNFTFSAMRPSPDKNRMPHRAAGKESGVLSRWT